ncbi:MAG TPA: DUF1566 domain-containing protein [Acinetobacter parvus]|uniref:Lcl C-terminal domain-containing protein n=1 Tax=Acinetobacter parvus TaxID=134533 RepID=UPI002C7A39D2|nr:DUF1566 domain-containing protein [Acinetobacter parvus]HRM15578.1 DUF1566 domain-containing protein [Acinetobacter parvus]
MDKSLIQAALISSLFILTGCGGGGEKESSSPTPTPTPTPTPCNENQYLDENDCKNKKEQTLSDFVLPKYLGVQQSIGLSVKSSANLTVAYLSKTPTICSVSGEVLKGLAIGTCKVEASQTGNTQTLAAPPVTAETEIMQAGTKGILAATGVMFCSDTKKTGLLCNASLLGSLYQLGQDGEVQYGKPMNYTLLISKNSDQCVKDQVTGLIWELKTKDGSLQDVNWRYSWYNADMKKNGGFEGYQDRRDYDKKVTDSSCGDTLAKCNTKAYIDALNAQNYCGYSDWRMPNVEELSSILDYGQVSPAINPIFTYTSYANDYWTSQPVMGYDKVSKSAWNISFSVGLISDLGLKEGSKAIRAVRAGQ